MAAGETAEWSDYQQAEAQSARTFALVGFVFYLIGVAVGGIWVVLILVPLTVFPPGMPMGVVFFPLLWPGIPLAVAAGLTVWSWTNLKQIEAGRYQEAQAPTLVLGILGLVFALLVGGIFLIIAYAKLTNVTSPRPVAPTMAPQPPGVPPQPTGRVCPNCGRPIPMDAKFCNHCGHELP